MQQWGARPCQCPLPTSALAAVAPAESPGPARPSWCARELVEPQLEDIYGRCRIFTVY